MHGKHRCKSIYQFVGQKTCLLLEIDTKAGDVLSWPLLLACWKPWL